MKLVLAILVLVGAVVCDEKVHFYGDKVLRVTPDNAAQVEFLRGIREEHDFWTEILHTGLPTDIHVSSDQLDSLEEQLKGLDIKYDVMIEDLEKKIEGENAELSRNLQASNGNFHYRTYNRVDKIHGELRRLNKVYPDITSLFSVGRSAENRELNGIKISVGASNKPVIWVDGCIHAREWMSCATVVYFMKMLLEPRPEFKAKVALALSKYDFYILPVFNPDGYEFSHTNNRMWRKTRSTGRRCPGVDPNRNWDSSWGVVGTSPNPCSDIYRGPKPFSEIEVKQVADKLAQLHASVGVKAFWNVHAYSQLVLYAWGWTTTQTKDNKEIDRIANVFAKGVYQVNRKTFKPGQPSRILYSAGGGSMDWTYEKLGIVYSYGPELRPGYNYPGNGFIMSSLQIEPSGLEFTNGLLDTCAAML